MHLLCDVAEHSRYGVCGLGNYRDTAKSEVASCGGGEETSPLDHVKEEKLRNKSWLVAAGGKNPKGRVYRVEKLNEGYLSRETFTQQTSTSAADSQKIIRLEEEIRQSREDFHQSREENQRLQRKLESLVNVVLPLLPPSAQIILQDMNEQPQNDHQNQNHAQEGEQHDGHSGSRRGCQFALPLAPYRHFALTSFFASFQLSQLSCVSYQALMWLASQVSILYGVGNERDFVLDFVKKCVMVGAFVLLLFPKIRIILNYIVFNPWVFDSTGFKFKGVSQRSHVVANVKLALFYDWLLFDERVDNIMNIEPAVLLMVHSILQYIGDREGV
ncbi:hypothetical protein Fmac_005343 [Flemingia macrophylla]|uniref:Integrator complex subunit 3 N-terminal domain-containing protein n=1 Tax=Flemingia macrophylla TaxID=520843 RepID=A0ABD1N8V4_9FABA